MCVGMGKDRDGAHKRAAEASGDESWLLPGGLPSSSIDARLQQACGPETGGQARAGEV